jgi:hypothetical protein
MVVITVVVAVLLLAVAGTALAVLRRPPSRAERTIPGVGAVEIALAAGRVEISEGDRPDARLQLTVSHRLARPEPNVTLAGDVLRINGTGSEARIQLTLPRGTRVRAEVRDGEITLWGSDGELVLITETGTIAGRDLGGTRLSARSLSGDISAHFTSKPDIVTAVSDTGSVTLVVPGGPYAVDAACADPSAATVDVAVDPAAERRLAARSRAGRVVVAAAAAGPVRI